MRFKEYEELLEASYPGNIGIMELIKFKQKANDKQKKEFDDHVKNKRHEQAWKVVQHVTGVKLHKSIHEKQEFESKAGGGEDGSDRLVNSYMRDTPGYEQKKKPISFKKYVKQ
jgi:hypothetical protein